MRSRRDRGVREKPNPEILPAQFRVSGGPVFASVTNPAVYDTRPGYFSPRFGFAWTPGGNAGRTVVRGGAGVFVFPLGTGGINQPGFSRQTDVAATSGGWIVNEIYSFESGARFSWGDVIYLGGDLSYDARNVNGRAFDTSPFVTASNQQHAFAIRTFSSRFSDIRADATNNLDASLLKNTRLGDKINLQLRVEAFNAFIHVRFGGPNLCPTSSSFGRTTGQDKLPRNIQLGARLV